MKDLVLSSIKNGLIGKDSINEPYYYVTIHRPYNTDEKERLVYILNELNKLDKKVCFSIHPRTKNAMKRNGMLESDFPNISFFTPKPYFENLTMLYHSDALITDSGGMQKEAYWLEKKCITIRKETEWVETLEGNANELMFADLTDLNEKLQIPIENWNQHLYGDGKAGEKIGQIIHQFLK